MLTNLNFQQKYALACKFFEYIFEPVLAPKNSFFYAIGFHKFIATFLYILFESKDAYAEDILRDFEALMRHRDTGHLESLLSPTDRGITLSDPLGQIMTFALCHQNRIMGEVSTLKESDSVSKWALELTGTALFWLLSYWGERFESLDVYCDKSKPLEGNQPLFDAMIGRHDKIYMRFGSHPEVAMTFNLAGPLNLVESHQYHGVQIADILSSSIAYALKNPDEVLSQRWLSIVESTISGESVIPAPELIDLRVKEPFINAMILGELTDRSVKGISLLDNLDEFMVMADYAYRRAHLESEETFI